MALIINLKRGARMIVNGAVLKNSSQQAIAFAVLNEAAVLREEDVIAPDAAVTPARRVYYALQCAYLFPENTAECLEQFERLLDEYVAAAGSAAPIAAAARAAVAAGNYYAALKKVQSLVEHETDVLSRCPAGKPDPSCAPGDDKPQNG